MAPLLFFFLLGSVYSIPFQDSEQCGYKGCPKTEPGVLNVHIVAHTHDDVGWLKTVDQYYYGSRNDIQKAGVQYIIDSVVKELWEDPNRKFIYVETAFFWKWWVRQPQSTQDKVRTLVDEGRLQFVGGAWSMNDEAASHYQSTVDQFTWGLRKLNETFGPCSLPRVGWQIDPFGHAREFASILAGMGYDGLFLGRIDYQDKTNRLRNKNMEMVWRGDDDLGSPSDIFTGVLYNTYSPPPGFCFDVLCSDEPIIDDVDSPMYNVDNKISMFIDYVKNQARAYRTNNVIITMGGDFTYQDATMWYTNLDKLIQYTNLKAAKDGLGLKLYYSTPNCYLKSVKEANPTLPTKSDDFFPYASDPNSYWTGYFTSRPTTKYFERRGNAYLQSAKQLQILAGLEKHNEFVLDELKSAMGVMQHHDAITGTEKQHVTSDYVRLLDRAVEDSLLIARQAFNKVLQGDALKPPILSFDRCRLNESSCHTSENSDRFVVTLYNPIAWKVNESVRIPVTEGDYDVYAPNGDKIDSQLVAIPSPILEIPSRHSSATHELVFIAHLKPLMIKSFYIQKHTRSKRNTEEIYKNINDVYDNERMGGVKDYRNMNGIHKGLNDRNKRDINDIYRKSQDVYDVNEYWNENKEKMDLEIKYIEENVALKHRIVHIPLHADVNRPLLTDFNYEKDSEDHLGHIPLQVSTNAPILSDFNANKGRASGREYPEFGEDEMRMLSDDPMIVERLDDYFVMENENIRLHVDNTSGSVKSLSYQHDGVNMSVNFYYYPGCVGNNEIAQNRSSGAYIFRPNATKPKALQKEDFKVVNGKVVKELQLKWSDNVFSTVRMYEDFDYLELDWVVGPIDVNDRVGKEFVVKYETDLVNNGEFYTDSNGRQVLKRKLNERPQYNVTLEEPVGGNYYPVTNEIYLEDDEHRFTVLTDRSEGGASLIEGELELMLHRRLLHDDAFGVGEALNEIDNGNGLIVRGTHRFMLSSSKDSRKKEMANVFKLHLQPLVFVSDAKDLNKDDWLKMSNCQSWLKDTLPEGLHLLTLEPWDDKLLLRIENYLTKADGGNLEVDISSILKNINIKSVKETNLSANEIKEKWEWKKENEFDASNDAEVRDDGFKVKIKPKQIRTFILDYDFVQ